MGKDSSPNTSGLGTAAYQEAAQAQNMFNLANQEFYYGLNRASRFADPVLTGFMNLLGLTSQAPAGAFGPEAQAQMGPGGSGGGPGGAAWLGSSMMQVPVAAAESQLQQAINQILTNVPPGPQQNALIAQAQNQMNQNLGIGAFGMVNNMLNALLGQAGAGQQGMAMANQAMGTGGQMLSAAGNMQGQIAQLQMQASQANNSMLSGIFGTIGQIGGMILGGPIGGMIGGGIGGLFGGGGGGGGTTFPGLGNVMSGWLQ